MFCHSRFYVFCSYGIKRIDNPYLKIKRFNISSHAIQCSRSMESVAVCIGI
ncbi:hypothetical protein [Helicobacter aurati]|uniref:hypothetical protein n=1 Tax=Helicobacter aurati TaxID=137778 RepID=UPI0013154D55|nr:hypothetical protein [Helicobacter aurati]